MNRSVLLAAWIPLLAVATPISARAQSLSISGIVLDQSGATIPGALITLRKGEDGPHKRAQLELLTLNE
jgi:hypothetical protein